MIEERRHRPSATCLTGIASQSYILANFKDFKVASRVHPFTAEEMYLIQNKLPVIDPNLKLSPKSYLGQKKNEVIHVLIDK